MPLFDCPQYLQVHRTPEWNTPPPTKFAVGDVVADPHGEICSIISAVPAPATSALRCRGHYYYVRNTNGLPNERLLSECELTKKEP